LDIDAVRFLGKLEAVEKYCLWRTFFDAVGKNRLAALEAMACEVPFSSDAGLPELMIQGVTGFMSPVGDIEDMTRHALFILDKNYLNSRRMLETLRVISQDSAAL
jgi:glycosyltransferase involved in cell wall biosynthesis